jgi:hypothetical protein
MKQHHVRKEENCRQDGVKVKTTKDNFENRAISLYMQFIHLGPKPFETWLYAGLLGLCIGSINIPPAWS